jgi:hypothetical protein
MTPLRATPLALFGQSSHITDIGNSTEGNKDSRGTTEAKQGNDLEQRQSKRYKGNHNDHGSSREIYM